MRPSFIILLFILLSSIGASASNGVNFCNEVLAPQDFLIQLKFEKVPNLIDFTKEDDDSGIEFEVYLSPDSEIDALRCNIHNQQHNILLLKRSDKSEPQFPNLLKAINAQYENRAQQFPKPSYYHFLFRLYPF